MKNFDLNIEKILENWEPRHAIREIIANALDEQALTKTKEVEISKKGNVWIIRDYGRGLNYTHLTQKENQEKLSHSGVIGKFGIGLKDALATFDRRNITVMAKSKHGKITIAKMAKQSFQDMSTLHGIIDESAKDLSFVGTEFELRGVKDSDIAEAKKLFLKFSNEEVIEDTKQGQVIKRHKGSGNIYINGVKVAEEENFLFSYNITVLTTPIKKALNRERTNVGRTAYSDSVKKILLSSSKKEVAVALANDLSAISSGTIHDELKWVEVQEHSVKIMNHSTKCLFATAQEVMNRPHMIDEAKSRGHEVIVIPDNLRARITNSKDFHGNPIVDMGQFISNYNDDFKFDFVDPDRLSKKEQDVFSCTSKVIKLFGGRPRYVKDIKITSTMRKSFDADDSTLGLWDDESKSIIISRKALKTVASYSGTLIHELIHAKTGSEDVTRQFENDLTDTIGNICEKIINR